MDPELIKVLEKLPDDEVKRLLNLYGGGTFKQQLGAQCSTAAATFVNFLIWAIVAIVVFACAVSALVGFADWNYHGGFQQSSVPRPAPTVEVRRALPVKPSPTPTQWRVRADQNGNSIAEIRP
jgi:hypothetical protein